MSTPEVMLARIDERTEKIVSNMKEMSESLNELRDKVNKMEGADIPARVKVLEKDRSNDAARLSRMETIVQPMWAVASIVVASVVNFVFGSGKG